MKKLVIANWKMNPENIKDAKKIFADLKKKNLKIKKTIPVICPPFTYLDEISGSYRGSAYKFGAQDVSDKKDGEQTGEISIEMLKNLKCQYVIVGHAERRALGEDNETVSLKTKAVIDSGLKAVVCVGENDRDHGGSYLRFIEEELHESLSKIKKDKTKNLVIAYEPIWAVGKGHDAISGHELHQISLFIRKVLVGIYGKKIGMNVPVIYGGSVDADNSEEIINTGEVDGLLVGRASLNPHVFADILKELEK